MRLCIVPVIAVLYSILSGCASAPNEPTLTLQTKKTPEAFSACVVPKLQGNALSPVLSQAQHRYRIVVPSAVTADNVMEAYRAPAGGRVFVYERSLLNSGFEQAARECA